MIAFLSFAPVEFMGGAEKMMYKLATFIKKNEDVVVINADKSIANIYGSVVLKRKFPDRMTNLEKQNSLPKMKIHFADFIPYSNGWKNIHGQLKNARLIYIKYEVLELFFLFYFGGFSIIKKTIASLHSPLLYDTHHKLSDRLHTLIYSSKFNRMVLKQTRKIHVLNIRDELYLREKCQLKNVIRIPNSLPLMSRQEKQKIHYDKNKLSLLFVGELSIRKGADILIELIQNVSEDDYFFSVAGDGPMRNNLLNKCKQKKNWKYFGYLQEEKLKKLYAKNDVLFAPSRAEGLSLVMLEALSHGLKLIGYDTILSDFSYLAKSSSKHNLVKEYESILGKMYVDKGDRVSIQTKQKIKDYFVNNFSDKIILPIIQEKLFAINT